MRLIARAVAAVVVLGLAQLPALATTGPQTPARSPLHTIPFHTGAVDPAVDWRAMVPRERDLVLVQLAAFGRPGMVDRLARTGAALVQPLAPVSYLVWADAAQTRALRRIDGVRWAGVLPPATRVTPSVTAATTSLQVTVVGRVELPGLTAAWSRPFTGIAGTVVEVAGSLADADRLARLPRVYSVVDAGSPPELRDERSAQIVTGTFDDELEPVPGYAKFLESIRADGTGVVIAHVDGGVDFNHPDLEGRVAGCIDYTAGNGAGCTVNNHDDVIGHGTHTLGIVLGTGSSGLADSDGFLYGQGIAPGAQAIVQNAIGLGANPEGGYRSYYVDAWELGKAIVSANSWGPSGSPKGYDADTREFDSIPRDIDDKKAGDQPQAFVLSIMNGSGGKSTQGTPDEGKNLIRVGGSGNRNGPRHQDLCTCTAHGPALDGRMLPDVVAPGQNVISTKAMQGTLCGLSGTARELPPSPLHAPCTGTSMASPHVTGGYAVFVDWYRKRFKTTPSPALVKGAIVNGATDLSRFEGVDADGEKLAPIPNNQQGWGRFNLAETIDSWRKGVVHVDQSKIFTDSKQSFSLKVKPVDPRKPMKATLVWTDALGHGKGGKLPAWVNDLDLTVKAGRTTWRGNVFKNGWSATGGKPDRMNNIENVYLKGPSAGVLSITVNAASIIGNGLPNRKGATDQDFALIITNARRLR